jgi:hypothetical protein
MVSLRSFATRSTERAVNVAPQVSFTSIQLAKHTNFGLH